MTVIEIMPAVEKWHHLLSEITKFWALDFSCTKCNIL